MDQNQNMNNMEEGQEIDFLAMAMQLWKGRKTIILTTCIFIVLGLIAALTMKRVYTVNTMMVPQMSSKGSSSLSSLASLAGIDLGSSSGTSELSPIIYPEIVNSVPFQLELMYTPLHWAKADTAVSMIDYARDYMKPTTFDLIKKYTIGLPGVILGAMSKEKPEVSLPGDAADDNEAKPVVVTKAEEKMLKVLSANVTLVADKKEGTLTLTIIGSEPIQTAELALKAQQLLQREIIRFRTEKAQAELDYIQERYDEVKAEAEACQVQLATITDKSQNTITTRDRIERDRIQAKYTLANSIYGELAKQLESAKMKVKQDSPTFTIVKPVKVPMKASNSRAKTLAMWVFMGIVLGCGIVLGKDYLPKLREKLAQAQASDPELPEQESSNQENE